MPATLSASCECSCGGKQMQSMHKNRSEGHFQTDYMKHVACQHSTLSQLISLPLAWQQGCYAAVPSAACLPERSHAAVQGLMCALQLVHLQTAYMGEGLSTCLKLLQLQPAGRSTRAASLSHACRLLTTQP